MRAAATARWAEAPDFVRVWHPGDANGYVEMRRPHDRGVSQQAAALYFDSATGDLLFAAPDLRPAMAAQRFLAGLHLIQFRHWPLRWLYFACGLLGCVLIGTGLLFWVQARRKRHLAQNLKGVRVVEGMAVGASLGLMLATLLLLVANRLLPPDLVDRAAAELWVFHLAWAAAFAHGWRRGRCAWADQALALAGTAVLAVLLNALTTGDSIPAAAARGQWGVAGMDLMLLALAALSLIAARRLAR